MFICRSCKKEDRSLWIKLNRAFMAEEIQDEDLWNNTQDVSEECFQKTFEEAMSLPEMIDLLFLEAEGEAIGFANLLTIFSVWTHGKSMVLDDLYIKPEERGKGYGKAALEQIEKFAKAKGCKRIQFQSELTNPNAREFYKAVGYIPSDMYFYLKYF
ncbi:MAG TPA: GNAT family N-acetyltransferase [Bacillota bacterium]|nr:GNAT family N-acetyltransferase [Bacillota bacterium]